MSKSSTSKINQRAAWCQGFDAWGQGVPLSTNPDGITSALFNDWKEGWFMAKEISEKNKGSPSGMRQIVAG